MLPIYRNIKELRLLHQWTQTDLAKKIGYADKGMISRIENGEIDLPLSKVKALAELFHVTPGVLFGSTENEPLSDFEKDLLNAYRQADAGTRASVAKLLDVDDRKKHYSVS